MTRWSGYLDTAEARVAELEAEHAGQGDGCSCPPADRPHQVGCLRDGVPDASTSTFTPVAALREDVSPQVEKLRNLLAGQRAAIEDPHDSPLHRDYRVPHDLPVPDTCRLDAAGLDEVGQHFLGGGA